MTVSVSSGGAAFSEPRNASRRVTEQGSTTILAAGALLLAGVLCLVAVDLCRVLRAKALAQTAADAAALAAARELALPSPQSPRDAAVQYAQLNGSTLRSCQCDRGSSEAIVAVEVPVRLLFLSPTRPVVGRARAVVEGGLQRFHMDQAKSGAEGRMAADDRAQAERERADGRGGLHPRQARPPPELQAGAALAPRDLRRPP